MLDEEINKLKEKKICFHCIGESYLKAEVQSQGSRLRCSYCGKIAKCYRIEEMVKKVDLAFNSHYEITSPDPDYWDLTKMADKESNYTWYREGDPIVDAIEDAAEIPTQAAQDIQSILEDKYFDFEAAKMGDETKYNSGTYYKTKWIDDECWQDEWREFEYVLKTETRFFNQNATDFLSSVFSGISEMDTIDHRPIIKIIGPGTDLSFLFRARSFQSRDKLKEALSHPDEFLGSPPSNLAQGGRMNAPGISVFYGANKPEIAIAEIRPPVGSDVVVARFEILRNLRLLDLTALRFVDTDDGSIFDETYIKKIEKSMFFATLSHRITMPVTPDHQVFEYLATQAIADYLAADKHLLLDGILFPSAQTYGNDHDPDGIIPAAEPDPTNIVLFHKAALVEQIRLPKGTIVNTTFDYDDEAHTKDIRVREEVPENAKIENDDLAEFQREFGYLINQIKKDPALKIDMNSIDVHEVRSVKYLTTRSSVSRYRIEMKNDLPF